MQPELKQEQEWKMVVKLLGGSVEKFTTDLVNRTLLTYYH
jgi:hypothetical protein